MNAEELENRFIDLEMLVADQERTIKDLSEIVARQVQIIERMQKEVAFLVENYDPSGTVKPLSEETPPPHY